MNPRTFKIAGTGVYLPKQKIQSTEIDKRFGLAAGSVFEKTGVAQRSVAAEGETQAMMGAIAAKRALDAAGLTFTDLDALVCANGACQRLIPCSAALLQRELGFGDSGVACFDVNATCLGFLCALDLLTPALAMGRYKNIMIVNADISSVGINWNHLESAALFGDASTATVLQASSDKSDTQILAANFETYGEGADYCCIPYGGSAKLGFNYTEASHEQFLFFMDGPKVYKVASRLISHFVKKMLNQAQLTMDDVDVVLAHQASKPAMELLRRKLGIAEEKFVSIIQDTGNCISASLPMVLHEAIKQQRLQKGQTCMLLGSGAGLSIGGMIIRY